MTDRDQNVVENKLGAPLEDASVRDLASEVARLDGLVRRYRGMVEQSPDTLVVVQADGTIEDVNPRVEELLGYTKQELVGKPVEVLVPWAVRDAHVKHRARYEEAPRARPMGAGLALTAVRKDGSVVPVEISLSPLTTSEGTLVLCAIRDATEARRVRDELERMNVTLEERVRARTAELEERTRELERSNSELEQFAYVASHDLQEPLRMVASSVRMLARQHEGSFDADSQELVQYAVEGAGRMQQLIQDLLKLSRVRSRGGQRERVELRECLEGAMENLELAIAETGAAVTCDRLPTVHADRSQMVQLFQNLVGNAIKFRGSDPPRVRVAAQRQGDAWLVSVRDNGIGIEACYHERIFVVFQRLHPRETYPGTGIGLALCRKIVELHGGRMGVHSEPGRGSTFWFTLPDQAVEEAS